MAVTKKRKSNNSKIYTVYQKRFLLLNYPISSYDYRVCGFDSISSSFSQAYTKFLTKPLQHPFSCMVWNLYVLKFFSGSMYVTAAINGHIMIDLRMVQKVDLQGENTMRLDRKI